MGNFAIKLNGIGKKYLIQTSAGAASPKSLLREDVERALTAPWRWLGGLRDGAGQANRDPVFPTQQIRAEEFWALTNVSFEVGHGEVVGLIGSNGAGKSTLLKILSRVVLPTTGSAVIRGRVGSLLEVGAGFHPELSGHENIFLNGALIGMKQQEIRRKYDEIVEFSGIKKFLYMPVKHYSSGMYVRLAFSIAVNLDTDILFLDEVLSVGDAEFQERSLRKIRDVLKSGRTVILVSHSTSAIRSFCNRAILLEHGRVVHDGEVEGTIKDYTDTITTTQERPLGEKVWSDISEAPGGMVARIKAVRIVKKGAICLQVSSDEEFSIDIEYQVLVDNVKLNASITLYDNTGYPLLTVNNYRSACIDIGDYKQEYHKKGRYESKCQIPGFFLNSGEFSIYANIIHDTVPEAQADHCLRFTVIDGPAMHDEYRGYWPYPLRPRLNWGNYRLE